MKKELTIIILLMLTIFLFGCVEVPEEKSSDVRVVCVNAEDGRLCGGLGFVFGDGYEGSCCEGFRVCCG